MSRSERFSRGNLIFLFLVAFFVGFIAKKAVGNHVRIGYDDPSTVIVQGEFYNIDELEQKVLKQEIVNEKNLNDEINESGE